MSCANRLLLAAICLLGCVLAVPAVQAASLPSFDAGFRIMNGSLRLGTNEVSLTVGESGDYRYESHTWPSSWISWLLKQDLRELSRGVLDHTGIRPLHYDYRRTGSRGTRNAELTFDWKNSTVVNDVADSKWQMSIPAGTLDKLSTQLGIMMELQNGVTEKTFDVADGGKLKQYAFEIMGTETVDLPAGRFKAVKLRRTGVSADQPTYIWCAPELHYLPVRIVQRNKDKSEYLRELEWFSESLRAERTREQQ
jgi:hypothetical protein